MSDVDEEEGHARRTRRAVLGGAVAAGAAGIASTLLATAGPAGATARTAGGDLTPLIIGEVNQATNSTELDNTTGPCLNLSSTSGTVLQAFDQSGTSGIAVSGYSP